MSKMARVFERNGHSYQLYEVQADPVWNLFEDFGDEAALVGSITQNGPQFRIECYWKPEPGARLHDIGARTVDEAVSALLDLAAGEDPRGVMNRRVRSDGSTLRRAVIAITSANSITPRPQPRCSPRGELRRDRGRRGSCGRSCLTASQGPAIA